MPYLNPPLALVVCEIRFPEDVEGIGQRARQMIRKAVRRSLPLLEEVTEDTVQFNPSAPPVTMRQSFPRHAARDRTAALVVNRASIVVETTAYKGYQPFRSLIAEAARAVEEGMQPDGVLRVGLRYIDEIRVPGVEAMPGDWRGYIDDHLLATVAPEFLEQTKLTPVTWQGHVQYSTGPDSVLAVRYGPGMGYATNPEGPIRRRNPPPAGAFFLLDSDSFWEPKNEVPEFTSETVLKLCDKLHPPTRAIFEAVSTDRLRAEVYGGTTNEGAIAK